MTGDAVRRRLEETMDSISFDRLVRVMSDDASRRGVLHSAFAAVAGFGMTSMLSLEQAEAKKRKKKVTLCHSGQTITVGKKKKKKHLKHGDTIGACQTGTTTTPPPGGKTPGTLCDTSGECAAPNVCDIPVNDSGGDKRCCAPTAPCGLKDPDNDDDTSPFCCRGNTCTSTATTPGTCQLTP